MATFEVDVEGATYEVDAPDENTAWRMANEVHRSAPQESPSMKEGRQLNSSAQGFINAMQGPTMGLADELYGGLSATGRSIANAFGVGNEQSFGQNYQEARDTARGATQQFRQEYPVTGALTAAAASAPMMLVGGAPVAAIKGAIAPAPTAVGRLLTAGKVGAIQGGIAGAGESTAENATGVAADAAKNAVIGAGMGGGSQGVLSGAGAVIGNAAQRVSKTSATDVARLKLAEALSRSSGGIPVRPGGAASPSPAADMQFLGPEATIADVAGQSGKRVLDVLATLPGTAKDLTEKLIRGRQASRPDRIMTAADQALGTQGRGYAASLDALEEAQKAAQAPFRKQLEGLSVRADDELVKILNREPAAFKAAADLSRREGGSPIDFSKLKAGDNIPFNVLDTVKKALWTIAEKEKVNFTATAESRAVNGIRVALTAKMDRLSPKDAGGSIYKQAREAFGGPAELRSAIRDGRGAMKADAIGVAELTKNMGAGELEAFRIGVLQALRDKVGTEAGQTSLLKMWKETATSDKLKEIFGADYKKFASSVAKESKLKELEDVGRNSKTAERFFGAGDLDVMPVVQAAAGVAQSNPVQVMGAIPKIWNQVKTPETTRNALAALLLQRGQEGQQTLRDLPDFMREFNKAQARNSALANALAQQPARNQQ